MKPSDFPLELFFVPPHLNHIRESAKESDKVREWEQTIRHFAGERDGARVIEWARRHHADVAPTLSYRYTLVDVLVAAMDRLARGDTITADLEWRKK